MGEEKKSFYILIVEDDQHLQEAMARFLKAEGYTVFTASTPEEAVDVCRIHPIKMSIIDCVLPKMNGLDLSLKMKTEMGFSNMAIYLISGILGDQSRSSVAKKINVKGFLKKPFEMRALSQAVKDFFESQCVKDTEDKTSISTLSIDRYNHMLKSIKGKNAFEVFAYFGIEKGASKEKISEIYKKFIKANHPDKIFSSLSREDRDVITNIFYILNQSYSVIMDDEKVKVLEGELEQENRSKEIGAKNFFEDGLVFFKQHLHKEALKKFKEAYSIAEKPQYLLYAIWARILSMKDSTKPVDLEKLNTYKMKIETLSDEEKQTPIYNYVIGLIYKEQNEIESSLRHFKKALELDPRFSQARKDMIYLESKVKKPSLEDIDLKELLNQDVGTVFTSLVKEVKKKIS